MNAPVDLTDVRIETPRLILRPWREADLADFYEYASVDGVGQMAGWQPHKSMEDSRLILNSFIAQKRTFALELKENGKTIGSLGLEMTEEDPDIPSELAGREIGYVLSKTYWGRGLMPEAVKAVIDYCFRKLNFDYLTCCHFDRNRQSWRVIEKCGFAFLKDTRFERRDGVVEKSKKYLLYNPRKMTAPFDTAGIRIETERLLLRPIGEADAGDFREMVRDPEIADMGGCPHFQSEAELRQFVERHTADPETLALVLKQSGKMVGTISLQARDWEAYPLDRRLRGREFGFDLNREYWGRGLMPEALEAVVSHCFDTLGYDFVTCGYFLGNTRSARVMEKCGFTFLFDRKLTLSTGQTVRIRTLIRYNPHLEK